MAALLLTGSVPTMAQTDDFGLWSEVNVEKKLSKKWSLDAGLEYRNRDNMKTADRWSLGVDVNYKLTDWLKLSAGYSLLDDHYYKLNDSGKKYADYWGPRHRFNVSLTFDKKLIGDFRFSLRERWQYTYRPSQNVTRWSFFDNAYESEAHEYSGKGKNVLRSRLQIEYDKKGLAITPYANVELFNAWNVQKIRYNVGVDWKLSKQHSLGLFYRYQHVYDDDDDLEPNIHMLGLSYKFKF